MNRYTGARLVIRSTAQPAADIAEYLTPALRNILSLTTDAIEKAPLEKNAFLIAMALSRPEALTMLEDGEYSLNAVLIEEIITEALRNDPHDMLIGDTLIELVLSPENLAAYVTERLPLHTLDFTVKVHIVTSPFRVIPLFDKVCMVYGQGLVNSLHPVSVVEPIEASIIELTGCNTIFNECFIEEAAQHAEALSGIVKEDTLDIGSIFSEGLSLSDCEAQLGVAIVSEGEAGPNDDLDDWGDEYEREDAVVIAKEPV